MILSWNSEIIFIVYFSIVSLFGSVAIQTQPLGASAEDLSSLDSNRTSRQAFYNGRPPPTLHFQYQPELGGWKITWSSPQSINSNYPSFPDPNGSHQGTSAAPAVVGYGSSVTIHPARYPRPNNNVSQNRPHRNGTATFVPNKPNNVPAIPSVTTSPPANNRDTNQNQEQEVKVSESCTCGKLKNSRTLERITGGISSKDNAWPWMAAIVYVGSDPPFWFCGASLINDQYLITAAHCQKTIKKRGYANIRILMGTNGIPGAGSLADLYEIVDLKTHPMYKPSTEEYDIGLIKLKNKVTFTDKISPVCLTQRGSPFLDRMATVAGWGSIKYGDTPPDTLREVDLKVVSNSNCQREYLYHYGTRITNAMLCAWLPGKDSCQGDSGGPLFLKTTSEPLVYTQVGVVSFGPPNCGETTIPGVYTRIASAIRWIKANTKDSTYCTASF